GHRLEGHRQRDEEEGQTFTKMVGQEVLPKFLSVADDPTTKQIGDVKLSGPMILIMRGRRRSVWMSFKMGC
ncbi:MAG TPA: hypothetical protein VN223_05855, partial [Candidatus Elarobacter sp.]|nr:hypothetical protein [Candidatus Elarobacter sp.]